MNIKKTGGVFLALAITAFFIALLEWPYLADFNHILFGNYFDALKNYYTLLYHVRWDEHFFWFDGMNFPYGEHVLFTDNQPLLATILKLLHRAGLPIENYVIGIINSLLYVNLLLCTLFSYLCLTKLKVNLWVAVAVAVALPFLSPQTIRINGHFALSYSAIIPYLLYLSLLFLKNPTWRISLLIGISSIAVTFLHAYYLGFALLLFSMLIFISIWYKKVLLKKGLLHLFIQVFLAFLLVQCFMFATDPISDRPSHPWSPFLGQYTPHGLLIPLGTPIGDFIHKNFGIPQFSWEAETYIGGAAALLLIASIITLPMLFFKRLKRTHPFYIKTPEGAFLLMLSLTAILIPYIFAVLTKSSEIYQLMGPIRQFRSISRFVWIAFFSFNFYLFFWLSARIKSKPAALNYVFIALSLLLLGNDAFWSAQKPYHSHYEEPLFLANSPEQKMLEEATSEYDVLIPIPHFHVGAESFVLERGGGEHFKNSMAASYASGLPLTSVMLSRSSLSQSIKSINYIFPTIETPPFLEDLKNKRCLILIDDTNFLSSVEQHFLRASKKTIFSNAQFTLLELDTQKLIHFLAADTITKQFGETALKTGALYYQNFETSKEMAYFGSGSLNIKAQGTRHIDSVNTQSFPDVYTIGFWLQINTDTKAIEETKVTFYNTDGIEVGYQQWRVSNHFQALNKEWAFVELTVYKPTDGITMEIGFLKNNLYPTSTFIDGLTIKPVEP